MSDQAEKQSDKEERQKQRIVAQFRGQRMVQGRLKREVQDREEIW